MPLCPGVGSSLLLPSHAVMGRSRLISSHPFSCRYGEVSAHLFSSHLMPLWADLGSPLTASAVMGRSRLSVVRMRHVFFYIIDTVRRALPPLQGPLYAHRTQGLPGIAGNKTLFFHVATYHRFQVLSMHRAHRAFLACRATPDFSYRIDLLGLCLCIQWILLRQPGRWPYDR